MVFSEVNSPLLMQALHNAWYGEWRPLTSLTQTFLLYAMMLMKCGVFGINNNIYRMWKDPSQQQKMEPVVQIISAANWCSKIMITEATHIIVADSIVQPEHANNVLLMIFSSLIPCNLSPTWIAIHMANQIKERPTQTANFFFQHTKCPVKLKWRLY